MAIVCVNRSCLKHRICLTAVPSHDTGFACSALAESPSCERGSSGVSLCSHLFRAISSGVESQFFESNIERCDDCLSSIIINVRVFLLLIVQRSVRLELGIIVKVFQMIANSVQACLRDLQRLYHGRKDGEIEPQSQKDTESLSRAILSAIDRFKLWIYELKVAEGFLDRKLENSSHLQELVTQDLARLKEVLQEGLYERVPETEDMRAIVLDLQRIVDGLFDIVPAIQRPEPDVADDDHIGHYLGADLQHAERSFPKASKGLLKRFATANVLRRQRLRLIRQRHETEEETGPDDQSLIGGSASAPTSEFSDVSFDECFLRQETGTDSSNASEAGISHSRMPPLPGGVKEQIPFDCPICFKRQNNIRTWSSWK